MSWYLAIRRMREAPAAWADRLPAHLDWLHDMHEAGIVIMSGPSADLSLGIYVMRAGDAAEANRLARADPLLDSPGAKIELIEWQLHQVLGIGGF